MANVLCFVNQKGGVGKTTITLNLGAALASKKKYILYIDMDHQANLTENLLGETPRYTVFDVLTGKKSALEVIKPVNKYIDLLPANVLLSDIPGIYNNKDNAANFLLYNAIKEIIPGYDYILIDPPPSFDLLALNAIMASNYIYGVIAPEPYSIKGLDRLYSIINNIEALPGQPAKKVEGIIINKFNARRKIHKEIIEALENTNIKLIQPYIKDQVNLVEVSGTINGILSKASTASLQFKKLATNIIKGVK